jgi:hypothetical protein
MDTTFRVFVGSHTRLHTSIRSDINRYSEIMFSNIRSTW